MHQLESSGEAATLCEVVYDVRGVVRQDTLYRQTPHPPDLHVPYRFRRLTLEDNDDTPAGRRRRRRQEQLLQPRPPCERLERGHIHLREGDTRVRALHSDDKGYSMIDTDAMTIEWDAEVQALLRQSDETNKENKHPPTHAKQQVNTMVPDDIRFLQLAGLFPGNQLPHDFIRRYPWLIGRWPFTEEHRLHWIDDLNQWVMPQGEFPVSYLTFANGMFSTLPNGDNNFGSGPLPQPGLPCPRFLEHRHQNEESDNVRDLMEMARRQKAQELLERYEKQRQLRAAKLAQVNKRMEGKSEGDDVTGDVTGDGELTDGDGDLLSRSQLSKRSKKSDDDGLELWTDADDGEALTADIDELLSYDVNSELIYITDDVLLDGEDNADEEMELVFRDSSPTLTAGGTDDGGEVGWDVDRDAQRDLGMSDAGKRSRRSQRSQLDITANTNQAEQQEEETAKTPTPPIPLPSLPALPPLPAIPVEQPPPASRAPNPPTTDVEKRTKWRAQAAKRERAPPLPPPPAMTFIGRIKSASAASPVDDDANKVKDDGSGNKDELPALPPIPVEGSKTPASGRSRRSHLQPIEVPLPTKAETPQSNGRGPKKIDKSYEAELAKQRLAEQRRARAQAMLDRLRHSKKKTDDVGEGGAGAGYESGWLEQYCILDAENVEMFQRTFFMIDEMDRGRLTISEAMTGLRSLNIHMTDPQEEYMIRILELVGYPVRNGVDGRLFAIMAALSQKIVSVDDWVLNLPGYLDFRMLEMKTFLCKTLWEANVDAATKKLPIDNLCVELRAGGVGAVHEQEVRDKLGHLVALDLLDFLTYMPLFIMLHQSVIANPLDDSRDK